MNKFYGLLVVLGILATFSAKAEAGLGGLIAGKDGAFYAVVKSTSDNVFVGSGRLMGLVISTGNNLTSSVILDTATENGLPVYDGATHLSFAITPKIVHGSTSTVGLGTGEKFINFGEVGGLRFTNGLTVTGDGTANSVGVYYKRD
jgi:hypothetical protein